MKFKTPEMWLLVVFMLLDAFSTFDGFVTHYIFGHWWYDLNPLINYLVRGIAPWALIFFFIISFGLAIIFNEIIKKKYPQKHYYYRGFLGFFVLFELIACINNYGILFLHRL